MLEVGSMRLLVIPMLTKLAAASPFHGHFVSPGSKRAFLLALRTLLTIEVSPIRKIRSVTTVTGVRASVEIFSDCLD